jgi:hypothetical protein
MCHLAAWLTGRAALYLSLPFRASFKEQPMIRPSVLVRAAVLLGGASVLGSFSVRLQAQSAPAAPDTAAIPGARAPYQALLDWAPPPVLRSEPSYRVLLATGPTAIGLDSLEVRDTLMRSCPDVSRPAELPASYSSEPVSVDGSYLVVIALTQSSARGRCEVMWNSGRLATWRSLSLGGADTFGAPVPHAIRLLVSGREVTPVRAVARPAFELRGGAWQRVASQLRYYYDMSVLAPSSREPRRAMTVQVFDSRGSASSFEIDAVDLAKMQFGYAAWRLATSTAREHPTTLTPDRPVSAPVRAALDVAADGATTSGGLRAAELLTFTAPLDSNAYQRDVATMLLAEALLQHGDSAGARGFIRGVMTHRRCLTAPEGASSMLTAAVGTLRPRSCATVAPFKALAAGLVLPGGGHLVHHRPAYAAVAAGALVGVFGSALALDASAKSTYENYTHSINEKETVELYRRATARRASARARAGQGLMLWGVDAVAAMVMTVMQNHEVSNGRL